MKNIPETENALVLRTDFSDELAWRRVQAAIDEPVGEFRAYVETVSDPDFDGLTVDGLRSRMPAATTRRFMFIVDAETLSKEEHPILVVDLLDEPGRTFRVIPSSMWSVENNLSLSNMDFIEFAQSVDADGVFRGFPIV